MSKIKNIFLIVSYVVLGITISSHVCADDVIDSVNEGLQYYKNGKYTESASSLNYAVQLIQQKRVGSLKLLFPNPLKGWKAEEARSNAGGTIFGAGINASRKYNKGSSSVSIKVVADSPMLQGIMIMFSNPMFAQSDGGKLKKIGGQKAIVKYDAANKNGEILVAIANRFLITIRGNNVSEETLMDYTKAVDFKKIAELQ